MKGIVLCFLDQSKAIPLYHAITAKDSTIK